MISIVIKSYDCRILDKTREQRAGFYTGPGHRINNSAWWSRSFFDIPLRTERHQMSEETHFWYCTGLYKFWHNLKTNTLLSICCLANQICTKILKAILELWLMVRLLSIPHFSSIPHQWSLTVSILTQEAAWNNSICFS